jgi:drug/metabolite transporter (DMT)-like permease
VTPRKYLVLGAITVFGAVGDVLLSRGMKNLGAISVTNLPQAISALFNPWVALGTLLLVGFLAGYMSALSWADLTYVLPATSLGYVLVALLSQWFLGEHVNLTRWLGILMITGGVGFVAGGPSFTPKREREKIAAGES